MRVAFLSFQRGYYGGEVHLRDLAATMQRRGHEVTCLVRPRGALAERLRDDGIPTRTVNPGHWYHPLTVLDLRRQLQQRRPEILHTHAPHDYYLAAVASWGLPVLNVGTRHQLRPIGHASVKRPFLGRFRAMIAVSEAVRDGLLASGLPARKVVTVRNGIAVPTAAGDSGAARRVLALGADGGPVVGFVGRLCPSKGVLELVWAMSLLRGRWPGLRLVMVGEGPLHDRLTRLATRLKVDLRLVGYRPQAADLMPAFDLLAVPSVAEPFGLVTLEALARGVPVVATRSGGSREIIRDGVEGVLVGPGDPEALARGIHHLLRDQSALAACRAAGPRRVAQAFSLSQQVEATEQVYRLVLQGAPLPARVMPFGAGPERAAEESG